MKPVFLALVDRDGTINEEVDLLHHESRLALIPGAAKGIKLLNSSGVKVAIVTNQPVVARGMCTEDDVRRINRKLEGMLNREGASVDAVYYCPHHPDHPEEGNRKYRVDCYCRKPKTGMLEAASKQFSAPPERCFMIGDSTRDIAAGKSFGCRTILVGTGYGGKDGKYPAVPDYTCADLHEAAKIVAGIVGGNLQPVPGSGFGVPHGEVQHGEIRMQDMKGVILAGGLGTRLGAITEKTPKGLVVAEGKPVLEHQVLWMARHGIKDIVICVGHMAGSIMEYLGDGSRFGVRIVYSVEKELLGTGGALKHAGPLLSDRFIMFYGDLLVGMDLWKLVAFHAAKGGLGTLTVHESDHPYDSDIIGVAPDRRIIKFLGKPKHGQKFANISNAGVYCFEKAILKYFPDGKSMLDKEALPGVLGKGGKLYAYMTKEKIIDIGTPERLGRSLSRDSREGQNERA
jgi:histidinol-phosphate phosphatase family protein